MSKSVLIFALLWIVTATVQAQQKGIDYYSASSLRQAGRTLTAQARQSQAGIATKNLDKYSNHFTTLTVRARSGGAEVHEHYADTFIVVDGAATLVTGGTVRGSSTVSDGETRGLAVVGGNKQILRSGDIVHISPGIPHQLLLAHGASFTYFVIKVHE